MGFVFGVLFVFGMIALFKVAMFRGGWGRCITILVTIPGTGAGTGTTRIGRGAAAVRGWRGRGGKARCARRARS